MAIASHGSASVTCGGAVWTCGAEAASGGPSATAGGAAESTNRAPTHTALATMRAHSGAGLRSTARLLDASRAPQLDQPALVVGGSAGVGGHDLVQIDPVRNRLALP